MEKNNEGKSQEPKILNWAWHLLRARHS